MLRPPQGVNMQRVVMSQPRVLLKSSEKLAADAAIVRKALRESADAIIEQYPVG